MTRMQKFIRDAKAIRNGSMWHQVPPGRVVTACLLVFLDVLDIVHKVGRHYPAQKVQDFVDRVESNG
jgi:hypothetical protein